MVSGELRPERVGSCSLPDGDEACSSGSGVGTTSLRVMLAAPNGNVLSCDVAQSAANIEDDYQLEDARKLSRLSATSQY